MAVSTNLVSFKGRYRAPLKGSELVIYIYMYTHLFI